MLHGVNACAITPECGAAPAGITAAAPFHHVIFHHPHIGEENMLKHRALLGHFFAQACSRAVLATGGVVHVSLGGTQAADWKLHEQAARHGLCAVLQTVRNPLIVTS